MLHTCATVRLDNAIDVITEGMESGLPNFPNSVEEEFEFLNWGMKPSRGGIDFVCPSVRLSVHCGGKRES